MRNPLHRIQRPKDLSGVVFLVIMVAIVLIIAAVAQAGMFEGVNKPECRGTTAVYREYDHWNDRWERIVIPDDPACASEGW